MRFRRSETDLVHDSRGELQGQTLVQLRASVHEEGHRTVGNRKNVGAPIDQIGSPEQHALGALDDMHGDLFPLLIQNGDLVALPGAGVHLHVHVARYGDFQGRLVAELVNEWNDSKVDGY